MRGTPSHYFKSLNRPFNILGVDQQLFYLFLGLCMPIPFSARLSPVMDGVALLIYIILHTIGVLITRADNQMLAIYRRHIHFKKYYRANPGVHAPLKITKPSVPFYEGMRGLV
jgi:type IV secretory pathway TrbD component